MPWLLARVGQLCGGCGERINAATPMRRLETGRVRCVACAKRLLNEDPPATLTPPASPDSPVERLREITARYVTATQQAALDFKAKASGDKS